MGLYQLMLSVTESIVSYTLTVLLKGIEGKQCIQCCTEQFGCEITECIWHGIFITTFSYIMGNGTKITSSPSCAIRHIGFTITYHLVNHAVSPKQ